MPRAGLKKMGRFEDPHQCGQHLKILVFRGPAIARSKQLSLWIHIQPMRGYVRLRDVAPGQSKKGAQLVPRLYYSTPA